MIEDILPGTNARLRVLIGIYGNPGINLTSLIKKAKTSPNIVLKYVNCLRDFKIVEEERIMGNKRVYLRRIMPSFKNNLARIVFSLVEINKKFLFFEKYPELKNFFWQLGEIMGKKTGFALVYGSFARFSAAKESDLDILIVGKLSTEQISRIKEVFIALSHEPSIKVEALAQFRRNLHKPLYQSILKEHIVVYGEENFISCSN